MPVRRALGIAGAILLASATFAQQQPIHGCNAAASCRPLGYSTLDKTGGLGGFFFGFGVRFGPGFEIFLPMPPATPAAQGREPATPKSDLFNLGVSLLPPTPVPTPVPTPSGPPPRAKS